MWRVLALAVFPTTNADDAGARSPGGEALGGARWRSHPLDKLGLLQRLQPRRSAGPGHDRDTVQRQLQTRSWDPLESIVWPPNSIMNDLNLSFVITDVEKVDEKNNVFIVRADMQMWWADPRWYESLDHVYEEQCQNAPGSNTSEPLQYVLQYCDPEVRRREILDIMWKWFTTPFNSWMDRAMELWGRLFPLATPTTAMPWTPIPPELQPHSSDNPRSLTESDPFIAFTPAWNSSERFTAVWYDNWATKFHVNLNFNKYPFDTQTFDLCLFFKDRVNPQLQRQILDIETGFASLDRIAARSDVGYEESSFSPHVGKLAVESLLWQGFFTRSVETRTRRSGMGSEICIQIRASRVILNIIMRFFGPLLLVVLIPNAAFWMPAEQVMPRVATGFLSFLSLQVFRSMAYDLLPQKNAALHWIDICMLIVTQILFFTVVQNIATEYVHFARSPLAALHINGVARCVIPTGSMLLFIMLFVMGYAGCEPIVVMLVTNSVFTMGLVCMVVYTIHFMSRLPVRLTELLVKGLADKRLLFRDGVGLSERELAIIFRHLDQNKNGFIGAEEIFRILQTHGLKFDDELWSQALGHIDMQSQNQESLDLDGFRERFGGCFGGKVVRRLHCVKTDPENPESPRHI